MPCHTVKISQRRLALIAKNSYYLFDLLLYVQVSSYGHVGTFSVERDESNKANDQQILFSIKWKSTLRDFRLCVTSPLAYIAEALIAKFFRSKKTFE